MSARRFKADAPLRAGSFELAGEEARHLRVVLRGKPSERIVVFDGAGGEADAEIVSVGRLTVVCRTVSPIRQIPPPGTRIELACAFPRAGAADDVLRSAVETGATAIRPLLCERGVWKPDEASEPQRRERFERSAIAALKQSGRSHLPEFLAAATPKDVPIGTGTLALYGSVAPGARNVAEVVATRPSVERILVLVGPEGGLTEDEEAVLAARGAVPVRCGAGILRVGTAVVALLAHVAAAVE